VSKSRIRNFLLFVFSVIITLALVEAACFILNRSPWHDIIPYTKDFSATRGAGPPYTGEFELKLREIQARFPGRGLQMFDYEKLDVSQRINSGYVKFADGTVSAPKPGAVYESKVTEKITGKIIYDVHYSLDEYGRRITLQKNLPARNKHALFFGCSFTFGEGVNDDETLPAAFSRSATSYHTYNLGFSGAAPNGILERIRTTNFLDGVTEREGIGIYVFTTSHVERLLGRMSLIATWTDSQAYATENAAGEIQVDGTFASRRPLMTMFYQLFWKTEFRKFFKFDWPKYFTDEQLGFFARVVLALKNDYQKKFGPNEFYVVIYPGQGTLAYEMRKQFDKVKIKYLDYSPLDLSTLTATPVQIQGEGHPNAEGYRITGDLVANDLGLSESGHFSKHRK
jgi:hypothetical protein